MSELFQRNKIFYSLTIVFVTIGGLLLFLTEKGDIEIIVNQHRHPFWDWFFYYITYLGDGRIIAFIIFLLLIYKVYYGIYGIILFVTSTVVIQVMKRIIFHGFPRPSKFFPPSAGIKYIDGLEMHSWYSFPSGHSSGVFTIFLLLSLIFPNKYWQLFCFTIAFLTAFSRVYLLQHFYMDIYGGTLLAVILTSVGYFLLEKKTYLSSNPRLNRPLF